ncbi:unnamed protein product [Larinioides sclopetarius]|uniref:Uncharacterized protein n=1 Tax=Larinioides sclopetarius TaxID=280406 RepID=A0AAV1ZUE1_9ARAC
MGRFFSATEMQYIPLILAVVFTGHLVSSGGSVENDKFVLQFNCIGSSGNQQLCNSYLHCLNAIEYQYKKPYYECLHQVKPKGGVGSCSNTKELYESTEKRNELNGCYVSLTRQPDGSDWTTIPGLNGFKDCVSNVGAQCLQDKLKVV